ncbi:MAG: hypothetical protein M3374_07195 [Pseudomonadota bacterium]|nr:hypothetical protein [Pseudomonadota bacterium]
MDVRLMLVSAAIAASALFGPPAHAHDPAQFDRMMGEEAKPAAACAQLAALHSQAGEARNAEFKALKTRCDAEKAAAKSASKTR